MKKLFSFAAVLTFLFSTVGFASFKIDVCKNFVGEVVHAGIPNFGVYHVFVQSNVHGALNFGPVVSNLKKMVRNDLLPANVTKEEHPRAECRTVYESDDGEEFVKIWSKIEAHYAKVVEDGTKYNLWGDRGGKNCGMVAQKAVQKAGLEFPFRNINGQDYTKKLMGGVRALQRGDLSRVGDVAQGAAGALGGIVREIPVQAPVGRALQESARAVEAVQPQVERAVRDIGRTFSNLRFGW